MAVLSLVEMIGLKILVAHHKPYPMPADPAYCPFDVRTAELDHRHWCELTALYCAWKTGADEVLGLVHYRRHFKGRDGIASTAEITAALDGVDVILPCKRRYWIETNYSHYVHAHPAEGLDRTRAIIAVRCPEYLDSFDAVMKRRGGHRFNMLVMRRDVLNRYCTWLFGILFELERQLDISSYSPYDARVFGFVAERLLDVWIGANRVPYRELRVLNLEPQHWVRKIIAFLRRKFLAKGTIAA